MNDQRPPAEQSAPRPAKDMNLQYPDTPSTRRPLWTTVLTLTALAGVVSLLALLGILIDYFADIGFGRYFMAIGLWGLPVAFVGQMALLVWAAVQRSRMNRRFSQS